MSTQPTEHWKAEVSAASWHNWQGVACWAVGPPGTKLAGRWIYLQGMYTKQQAISHYTERLKPWQT